MHKGTLVHPYTNLYKIWDLDTNVYKHRYKHTQDYIKSHTYVHLLPKVYQKPIIDKKTQLQTNAKKRKELIHK